MEKKTTDNPNSPKTEEVHSDFTSNSAKKMHVSFYECM